MYYRALKKYCYAFLAMPLCLLGSCATSTTGTATTTSSNVVAQPPTAGTATCEYDRDRLFALDMNGFDQDLEGGWRALANQNGCLPVAAELIRDYHAAQPEKSYLLYWHEGQVRALSGEAAKATELFAMSYTTALDDTFGWNLYVDATIAFMKQDKASLLKAYVALANLPVPQNAELDQNGNSVADSWPPNMEVVENLLACFDRAYREAYLNCKS